MSATACKPVRRTLSSAGPQPTFTLREKRLISGQNDDSCDWPVSWKSLWVIFTGWPLSRSEAVLQQMWRDQRPCSIAVKQDLDTARASFYCNINPLAFKKRLRTRSLPKHTYTNCSIQLNANDIRIDYEWFTQFCLSLMGLNVSKVTNLEAKDYLN